MLGTMTTQSTRLMVKPILVLPRASCSAYGTNMRPFSAVPVASSANKGAVGAATSGLRVHRTNTSYEKRTKKTTVGTKIAPIKLLADRKDVRKRASSPEATSSHSRG